HVGIDRGDAVVFLLHEIEIARRRTHRGARRIAEHFLEAAIAAHGLPVTRELDANDDVVQQRLLLGEHALQLFLRLALLGDVLDDPDRPSVRLARIDRAAIGTIPEGAAVLAPAQLHAPRRLAAHQRLVDAAALLVTALARIDDGGRLAVHLAGPVAVHLFV